MKSSTEISHLHKNYAKSKPFGSQFNIYNLVILTWVRELIVIQLDNKFFFSINLPINVSGNKEWNKKYENISPNDPKGRWLAKRWSSAL